METFAKLFGSLVVFVYHCFDRMVILGHMPLLTRPEHLVHFFRDLHGTWPITKEALRQRTNEYHRWVDAFARNHDIPVEWAQKGVRKEDYVRPALRRMERQQRFGVYFILKSMEVGPSFRISTPKFPTADPHYRLTAAPPEVGNCWSRDRAPHMSRRPDHCRSQHRPAQATADPTWRATAAPGH